MRIRFIPFMLKSKTLSGYISLLSPNECENNYKIILKYFQQLKTKKLSLHVISIENLETENIIHF